MNPDPGSRLTNRPARVTAPSRTSSPEPSTNFPGHNGWKHGGQLSNNPRSLREKFGGRWLTSEFGPGDLLTFRMDTIHGRIDNTTQRIRLSTDTRYQRSDEPVDERWVGENPNAHGPAGKRGLIC